MSIEMYKQSDSSSQNRHREMRTDVENNFRQKSVQES